MRFQNPLSALYINSNSLLILTLSCFCFSERSFGTQCQKYFTFLCLCKQLNGVWLLTYTPSLQVPAGYSSLSVPNSLNCFNVHQNFGRSRTPGWGASWMSSSPFSNRSFHLWIVAFEGHI